MVLCEHPTIILNKSRHVNKVYRNYNDWRIIIRGKECTYVPLPRKAKIQYDELEDCYYMNVITGEMIPCYLEVPCQKCLICRDRKAQQWATRVTCEGNYHVNCPWWITLTYNDVYCPPEGLVKRDLQNFFKRLRERVSRVVGEDIRLRFVAIGEYGGNTARPHYHAVVFGLPNLDPRQVLNLMEHAWSTRISFKKFRSVMNIYEDRAKDLTFVTSDKNGKSMYYLRYGFCYVKPAHDNTPMYLAKYMFKPEINTPKNCTPNFCLSSRKNGIGYDYIQDYMDYHRMNPEVTTIKFLNVHTAKLCEFGIPNYFKDYWFPTPSKIIPDECRKSFEVVRDEYARLRAISDELLKLHCDYIIDDSEILVDELNDKYFFYRPIVAQYTDISDLKFQEDIHSNYEWDILLREQYLFTYIKIQKEYNYLMSLKFSTDWMNDVLVLRDIHKGAIRQKMLSEPQPSVNELLYSLNERYILLKSKDMY